MDWQFKVGIGLTVGLAFAAFAVKEMPHWVTWPGLVIGCLFVVWGLPPLHSRVPVGVGALFIAGGALIAGSVAWYVDYSSPQPSGPNLSFQKLAVFWIDVGKDAYQIAAVTKFFNADEKAYTINGLLFDGKRWSWFPRGRSHLRGAYQNEPKAEVIEDNYIKPGSEAYFKERLPIIFDMTLEGGDMPDFVLRGNWSLTISGRTFQVSPRLYSVYPRPISERDWESLNKSGATIKIDDLYYKQIPPPPPPKAPLKYYLIYSADRTRIFDNPYFAQTPAQRGPDGVMVFICGPGEPPLGDGWSVLGNTYHEVWSDPVKLKLYNSLYPPDKDGLPRALGFFMGAENEMAGPINRPLMAPTTRAADIIDFYWPETSDANPSP